MTKDEYFAVQSVTNIVKINDECYSCLVKFAGIPEAVEFSAMPTDIEMYGRQIYADIKSGKYDASR